MEQGGGEYKGQCCRLRLTLARRKPNVELRLNTTESRGLVKVGGKWDQSAEIGSRGQGGCVKERED